DKSRLLAAMVEEIGIKASLAMLYRCQGCAPEHTVVLVKTESGTIVADPVYDLMFPRETRGYYDVQEMIDDPRILTSRLRILRFSRGPDDRISSYNESAYRYEFITTVNWRKYGWLAMTLSVLKKSGLAPGLIRRPAFLESPKLLFVSLCGASAILCALLA